MSNDSPVSRIGETAESLSSPFHRPIAFVDVETTGLDADIHEILGIGIVLAEQPSLTILSEHEFKLKPEHIETATPEALAVNGYTPDLWRNAMTQQQGMELYWGLTAEAVLCSHKIDFDSSFLKRALKEAGLIHDGDEVFGFRILDTLSMAWVHLYDSIPRYRSSIVAAKLGIEPEPKPHTPINGARQAYEIYKKLIERRTR